MVTFLNDEALLLAFHCILAASRLAKADRRILRGVVLLLVLYLLVAEDYGLLTVTAYNTTTVASGPSVTIEH